MFETAEWNTPNADYDSKNINHYLWAYCIGPMVGAAIGGFLYWIHRQTAKGEVKGVRVDMATSSED